MGKACKLPLINVCAFIMHATGDNTDICITMRDLFLFCSSFAHLSTTINVSDTKADNPKEFQKYFPRFMWLLRDVTNPPCNEDGEDIPLIEYLNDEVLISTGQEDCDKVIAAIRDLFPPPLMCDWLPLPNDDPEEWNLEDERNVDEYFLQRLDEVINGEGGIKASLTPKVGCDQVMVTGSDLAVLARFYVEAINKKDSVPSLEGSWKAVIKLKLAKEVETLVASYVQEMKEELTDEQPIEECTEEADCTFGKPTLMDLHKVIFTKKHEILTKKVRELLSNASESEQPAEESKDGQMIIQQFESAVVVKEGKKVKSGALYKFVNQNHWKSEKQCTDLWKKLEEDSGIYNAFTKALNRYNPEMCYVVVKDIHSLRENYNTEAIGPAKEEVFTAMNEKWQEREVVLRSIPGPPTNVAVVGKARDAIKLQWDEPKINPEAATTYIVEYRKGASAWIKDKETSEQWHIVRQLKSNTKYEFRVSSWNANAEKVKKTIEEMLQENTCGGLKMGTRLGRLARATLSTIGFLGGTAVAPLLSTIGMPALAMESEKKAVAAAACVSIPFFATLGAPIVGGRVAYHVMEATAACGDLEERYVHVPRQNSSEAQSAHSSTE